MAKERGRKSRKVKHQNRKCPRCQSESPGVKLSLGQKPFKANWCPTCEEVFTQRGVRLKVGKESFKGIHMPGMGTIK